MQLIGRTCYVRPGVGLNNLGKNGKSTPPFCYVAFTELFAFMQLICIFDLIDGVVLL